MSKAEWFAVMTPSTGEMIATSANQIVPPNSVDLQKCCPQTPPPPTPFPLAVLKGGLGTRLRKTMHTIPPNVYRTCESVGMTQESACEPMGVTQETRDHNYFRIRSVVNKVHPKKLMHHAH